METEHGQLQFLSTVTWIFFTSVKFFQSFQGDHLLLIAQSSRRIGKNKKKYNASFIFK